MINCMKWKSDIWLGLSVIELRLFTSTVGGLQLQNLLNVFDITQDFFNFLKKSETFSAFIVVSTKNSCFPPGNR